MTYSAVTSLGTHAIAEIARAPHSVLLATDLDGTLSPIVDDPTAAHPLPAALDALAELGVVLGQVAVVTGRRARTAVDLAGFRGRAGLERLVVLGHYGVERWDAAVDRFQTPPAPAGLTAAQAELPALLSGLALSQARVEDKGLAFAVHTRELTEPQQAFDRIGPLITCLATKHGLDVEPGKYVWEVRSASINKGDAIRALVAEFEPSLVVFMGDDLGDLPAFEVVQGLKAQGIVGVCVCSASNEESVLEPLADVIASGPEGIAEWLRDVAAEINDRSVASQR